jgi:hypothetical protein
VFGHVTTFSPAGDSINLSALPKLWTPVRMHGFTQASPKRRTRIV